MAKKPTEKQLYKLKNEWLGQFFEEVKPKEFYRAVFLEGSFERAGHFEDGKANGIITIVENDKAKNRIVFDDLSVIDEVKGAEFAVMSPVAYSGRNRTAANARWLYGIAIDLDGVEMPQLRDVFHQMNHDIIPKCTVLTAVTGCIYIICWKSRSLCISICRISSESSSMS